MSLLRCIVLSQPTTCRCCGGWMNAGRPALWGCGVTLCVSCYKKLYGEAAVDIDEKQILAQLMDGNTNPDFTLDKVSPRPEGASDGREPRA